jgi:hypothetical protein
MFDSLPPKGDLVEKAINLCLDNITKGVEPDHYQEVLKKLSEIKKR